MPVAHEVALVRRQVEADERLPTLRHRARLVVAQAGQAVLQRLEPRSERSGVLRGHELRDRHVSAREDRPPCDGPGGDLDLKGLPVEASGTQRREATELAGDVRPRLRCGQRGDHGLRGRHLDGGIRVPDLFVQRRALRRERSDAGQRHAARRVVRGARVDGLERDAPSAPRVVVVRAWEPVAEQARRAGEQLGAAERAARGLLGAEAVVAEGAVKRRQVGEAQAVLGGLGVPVRRQHARRQTEVVDLAVLRRPAVVGRVEEVSHPRRGVQRGDRRSGHAHEAQRGDGVVAGQRRDRGDGGLLGRSGDTLPHCPPAAPRHPGPPDGRLRVSTRSLARRDPPGRASAARGRGPSARDPQPRRRRARLEAAAV